MNGLKIKPPAYNYVAGRSALSRSASLSSSSPIFSRGLSSGTTLIAFDERSCCNSILASSAVCRRSWSIWSCGVEMAVVDPIASSMYDVWTSRSENWDSNLSITMEICLIERFITSELANQERWCRALVLGGTHAFKVHALHCFIHSSNNRCHVSCHLPHRDGCFYSACDGVYATGQSQEIQRFRLLPDGIGGVYPGSFVVALLQRLVERMRVRWEWSNGHVPSSADPFRDSRPSAPFWPVDLKSLL